MSDNNGIATSEHKGLDDRKAAFLTTIEVVKTKKRFFFLTLFLTLLGTTIGHNLQVEVFETTSTLFVQNINQPSAAEYLLNQSAFRLSRVDRIESYANHLKSDSFYLRIGEKIKFHKEFESLVLTAPSQKSKLNIGYWKKHLLGQKKPFKIENKLLTPIESIVGFLKGSVKYHTDFSSQFIQIHVKTLDARTSQLIANLIAEEFVDLTNRHSTDELKQIEEFVQAKKVETEEKVRFLDQKLIRFKRKNNIVSADASTRSLASRLTELESQMESTKLQIAENSKLIQYFRKNQKEQLNNILTKGSKVEGFGKYETQEILQTRLDRLKRQKSAFVAQGYKEEAWQITKINKDIDQTVSRLKEVVGMGANVESHLSPSKARERIEQLEASNQVLKSKISTLTSARRDLQKQVNRMPSLQQEFIQLKNQFELEVENLAALERKEKELEIQRVSQKKEVRVDQLASLPNATPRGSFVQKSLFSSLASLFLAILIIMGLESLDPTVKRRQDLYDCGVEFFGEIPFMSEKRESKKGKMDFGSPDDLVCVNNPDSIESMSFKYMRARIESMRYKNKKDCQVIAVSSALHNEGKSYISANLAITLAQLKRKVILVDADLRRPSQVAYFGISSQNGLVDLLNMKKDLSDVIKKEVYSNLDILPAGYCGTDSTELIGSNKFRILLDFLRSEYEYVVIDTPPTFAVVDAAVIAGFADLPILVSCFRETRKADLYEAYNDLLQVSYKKVYGLINKAIVSNSRIHYYGYPLGRQDQAPPQINTMAASDLETEEFMKKLGKKSS